MPSVGSTIESIGSVPLLNTMKFLTTIVLSFTLSSCASRTINNALSGALDGAIDGALGRENKHYHESEENMTRNMCAYALSEILKSNTITQEYILNWKPY